MDRRQLLTAGIVGAAGFAGVQAAAAPLPPVETASVDAKRTAFLNIDLQNCFVENSPAAAPEGRTLVRKLNSFAELCRSEGVLVVHTAHILRPGLTNAGLLAQHIGLIRDGMITKGNFSAAFHKDLVIAKRDVVLEKPRFGAFHGTDLEMILKTQGISNVIVGGISTNVCCETTAREASARDFRLFFLSDGTATPGVIGIPDLPAETVQKTTCANMAMFGTVLKLDEMTRGLQA